ncbi:MAG: hypothetical protein OIF47_00650 [Marinibacterium sp.]|nr:hypothetical protein [Marinibacterium sp.]
MTRLAPALGLMAAASPALAHADGSFHTHGAELVTALAVAAVAIAVIAAFRN